MTELDTLDVFVAHHSEQGYRMDLVGRTEQEAWDKLADAGEQRDTPKARRKAMAYGWSVVAMTLTRRAPPTSPQRFR